mgnify:CR=1 FL=1
MNWQAEVLFDGAAAGTALRLTAPISFWGGGDPHSSAITLASHPQRGVKIAGTLLVIPELIGSSSSSAILLELMHAGLAPRALILGHRDAILPVGVLVARAMDWPGMPVLVLPDPPFQTGQAMEIRPGGAIHSEDPHA